MTFQPRRSSGNLAAAGVLKPAQNKLPVRLWTGATVQRITSIKAADIKVELNGVAVTRPADGRRANSRVTPAGGAR